MNTQDGLLTGQVEITVKGAFKAEHTFMAGEGALGSLLTKGGKGEGVFTGTSGIVLELKKPSAWKNQYELLEGGNLLAAVQLPKVVRKAFEFEIAGQAYQLSPGGSKNRSWTLSTPQGAEVCEILPRGALKRGAILSLTSQAPLRLLVLAYYLVDKRWSEEAAASADF